MKPKNNRYTYIKYLRSQRAFVQALKPQVLVEPTLNNNVHLEEQQINLVPQLTNLENINELVVNELVETKSNEEVNIQDVINLEQEINYENNNNQNQDSDNEIFATTLINEQASGINEVSEQKQESPKVNKKHKKPVSYTHLTLPTICSV